MKECCCYCHRIIADGAPNTCLSPDCPCHKQNKGCVVCDLCEARMTVKDVSIHTCHKQNKECNITPESFIKAKYGAVLDLVMSPTYWDDKYPLLEKIIDELLSSQRQEVIEAVKTVIKKRVAELDILGQKEMQAECLKILTLIEGLEKLK